MNRYDVDICAQWRLRMVCGFPVWRQRLKIVISGAQVDG